MTSFGDQGGAIENLPFQQVDLCNSVKNLISDKQCTSEWVGDLLALPRFHAQYIVYRHGDRRDLITVFYGDRELSIKLDGDKTRILNQGDLDNSIAELILNKINRERIVNQKKNN